MSRWISVVVCLSALPLSAAADTVELTNGDLLHGTITEQTDQTVVIEHPVLGRVELPIDQVIAAKLGDESRFRSLQIGVSQESFGESMQRNMSWSGYERALPPEMIPHRLFDRLFGEREEGWVNRKRSILDAVRGDVRAMCAQFPIYE